MRLYHPKHGYHFETGTDQVQALKADGWVEAPKGFQNTLKEEQQKEVIAEPVKKHTEEVINEVIAPEVKDELKEKPSKNKLSIKTLLDLNA